MADIEPPQHPVVALRAAILAHGLQPVAVYTKGKRPFGFGWEQLRGLPPFVSGALSTGIRCDHVRAVDIDIDEPEAAERAAQIVGSILGFTPLVRTREDSPRCLMLYRGEGKKRVIKLPCGKVEVLGEGQQFVAYGVHPDGAEFEWPQDEPASARPNGRIIEPDDLDRLEEALHAALGGATPASSNGRTPDFDSGNDRSNRSAGTNWAQAALDAEIASVAGAPRGTRNDALNRAAFNVGQIVAGGALSRGAAEAALRSAASASGLAKDDGWPSVNKTIASGLASGAREPRSAPEREIPPTIVAAASQMAVRRNFRHTDPLAAVALGRNVDWRTPRGLIGQLSDWILETSRRPNRPLAVASATAILSGVCGRHLYGPTGTALNLYIACLAKTGVGKDRPLSAVAEVMNAGGLNKLATTAKVFSVSGFENLIAESPCCVASIDEMGTNLLGRISHKHASGDVQAIKALMQELWSRVYGKAPFLTTRRASAASVAIHSPSLTILGVSTPEQFYEAFRGGDALNGFLNRFLIAEGARRAPNPNEGDYFAPPAEALRRLIGLIPRVGGNLGDALGIFSNIAPVDERKMRWADAETAQAALAFDNQIGAIAETHKRGELLARTFEYTVRLASLHAVSNGVHTVDLEDLEWGASWALESARAMLRAADELMADSPYEANLNKVSAIIKADGTIKRGELLRRTRFLSSRDLDAMIEHLAGAGLIEKLQTPSSGGAPASLYRWQG